MSNYRPYTIKSGDTLSALAKRELGNANRWREITKENGKPFSEEEARRLAVGQIVYLATVNSSSSTASSALTISDSGLKFIADHEGIILNLYNDPVGHCTIGVGHLVHRGPINGSEPEEFKCGITRERAMELLRDDVKIAEQTIHKLVKVALNQNQFDALVSFVFNVGEQQFAKSTLLKKLNTGEYNAVPHELNRWVFADGQKLPGLITRRQHEGELFCK